MKHKNYIKITLAILIVLILYWGWHYVASHHIENDTKAVIIFSIKELDRNKYLTAKDIIGKSNINIYLTPYTFYMRGLCFNFDNIPIPNKVNSIVMLG